MERDPFSALTLKSDLKVTLGAKPRIKNDLIAMFEYYIGYSKPDEDYIDCFKRILEEISSKESGKTFKIIKLKKGESGK